MESPRARSSRRRRRSRPLLAVALAAVAAVGVTAGGTVYVQARAHSGGEPVSSATATPSASVSAYEAAGGEVSVDEVTVPEVDHDALLAEAMSAVTVPGEARVSVAVLALDSGAGATYGDSAFDTASIVKVDILAALLLQAQDAGRRLTAAEKTYAAAMIQNSDNDSASALWRSIGAAKGLDAANERLGLTATEGGTGMLWGLTQTTAADQLTLLRQIFGTDSDSALSAASRSYVQELMGTIAAGQRWGVSAAADGSSWRLKNGWLARSTTGLWDVNSIGRVTSGGAGYLVAVVSNGSATQAAGIALVESAARAAVTAVAGDGVSATATAGQ
ncbi:serine hydrolase [Streptomyces antibioticus]|uniref:serine hydrolase n=1 Tax=Streptomyces antibioticus TaxID=1890 RepID=UPI0033B193BD